MESAAHWTSGRKEGPRDFREAVLRTLDTNQALVLTWRNRSRRPRPGLTAMQHMVTGTEA